MSQLTRSSAQRSRPSSPYDDDAVATQEEPMSSDHEEDPEVSFHPHQPLPPHPVGQPLPAAGIYMPYIEGPCMDWTVNDHLYHRFLKWCLKCKNILECKLVALLEHQQCKKVITLSGGCRMGQYVSWNLSSNELTLDTIWGKYEEYCNHNPMKSGPDLIY